MGDGDPGEAQHLQRKREHQHDHDQRHRRLTRRHASPTTTAPAPATSSSVASGIPTTWGGSVEKVGVNQPDTNGHWFMPATTKRADGDRRGQRPDRAPRRDRAEHEHGRADARQVAEVLGPLGRA